MMDAKVYQKLNDNVGWLNLPKALALALFGLIDVLSEILDELKKMNDDRGSDRQ